MFCDSPLAFAHQMVIDDIVFCQAGVQLRFPFLSVSQPPTSSVARRPWLNPMRRATSRALSASGRLKQ